MATLSPSFTTTRLPMPSRSPCLCSPTNHPGSFRCSRHRGAQRAPGRSSPARANPASCGEAARSGGKAVKARSVRAHLMQLISPSCRDLGRRRAFQPRPSRLRLMNK